jgi:hypothetical protein
MIVFTVINWITVTGYVNKPLKLYYQFEYLARLAARFKVDYQLTGPLDWCKVGRIRWEAEHYVVSTD